MSDIKIKTEQDLLNMKLHTSSYTGKIKFLRVFGGWIYWGPFIPETDKPNTNIFSAISGVFVPDHKEDI